MPVYYLVASLLSPLQMSQINRAVPCLFCSNVTLRLQMASWSNTIGAVTFREEAYLVFTHVWPEFEIIFVGYLETYLSNVQSRLCNQPEEIARNLGL